MPDRDGFGPAPTETFETGITFPDGEFLAAPGDLVVLGTDGDLEYHPNALSPGNEAPVILLIDNADPRVVASEGPGPNVIDDVAGIVDGAVIYSDCCEPVSGNLYAATTASAGRVLVGIGFSPNLSPDGSNLIAGNSAVLTVNDTANGSGIGVYLNQRPDNQRTDEPFRTIDDLQWTDSSTFVALEQTVAQDAGDNAVTLVRYDAATLARGTDAADVGVVDDFARARFAGRDDDGNIAVMLSSGTDTLVRYFDPVTLAEMPGLTQTFPGSVTGIQIDPGGLGQIWVDQGTLYYLPTDAFEARPLVDEVLAAWFV